MTEHELNDHKMPDFRAAPSCGAVMLFANLHYASFSATISPNAARMLAIHLTNAANEADAVEQEALQDAVRASGVCSEVAA